MANTAIWPLRMLPSQLARTFRILAVSITVVALVGLAFAIGRWTDGSDNSPSPVPARVGHVAVQPVAPVACHLHGPC